MDMNSLLGVVLQMTEGEHKKITFLKLTIIFRNSAKIEHTLNTRRRASLNYRSPNHFFRVFDGGLV
ncbi:hypothetical protein AVI50_16600 (plasmid) [Piscirickettsia salmonis]|nr:hypothetical protein AVI50_16600 [Piscirickettsia salmonis]